VAAGRLLISGNNGGRGQWLATLVGANTHKKLHFHAPCQSLVPCCLSTAMLALTIEGVESLTSDAVLARCPLTVTAANLGWKQRPQKRSTMPLPHHYALGSERRDQDGAYQAAAPRSVVVRGREKVQHPARVLDPEPPLRRVADVRRVEALEVSQPRAEIGRTGWCWP